MDFGIAGVDGGAGSVTPVTFEPDARAARGDEFGGAIESARAGQEIQLAQAPQQAPGAQLDAAPGPANRVRICADGACVLVNPGNGTLTEQDISRFSSTYRDFIRRNDGLDLSPHAANVVGRDQGDFRTAYVASQFIGYNLPNGWGNTRIYTGTASDLRMSRDSAGNLSWELRQGMPPEGQYIMQLNMDWGDHRTNPSGLARTMIHEYLHRRDQMGMVTIVNDQHRAIDAEARQRIMTYGLGAGGCQPVGGGGLFGLIGPTYPGCN